MTQASENVVHVREIAVENPATGKRVEGLVFTGPGRAVVRRMGQETGLDSAEVLDRVVNRLLVNKGADWTSVILSEYLELYGDSRGAFSLVWDRASGELVSHGSVFQSAANPSAALVAHIRTSDDFKSLGLGTLVTEEVTRAALQQGADLVVLATDDKLHRVQQGERAAYSMYSKIGFAILAEKRLADTVDWLMVVDRPTFDLARQDKQTGGGRFPKELSDGVKRQQRELIERARGQFGQLTTDGLAQPVREGDLAGLFLLMNLCPEDDFRLKLSSWNVHLGPEFEREYIVSVRPAIVDRDRLQDASLVLRGENGAVVAICAARQEAPFTRRTMRVDFYCLPQLLENNRRAVVDLVEATLARIEQSSERPAPCRVSFTGADPAKISLFESLGFTRTGAVSTYHSPETNTDLEAVEFLRIID